MSQVRGAGGRQGRLGVPVQSGRGRRGLVVSSHITAPVRHDNITDRKLLLGSKPLHVVKYVSFFFFLAFHSGPQFLRKKKKKKKEECLVFTFLSHGDSFPLISVPFTGLVI